MKPIINILRILVGLLFIFSGLIKAIDPMGLSYKMQEFFDLWGWSQLNPYTLFLSVVMIAFEIIAGVAVIIGWQMRLFNWLLLLLILFFTFLTGYAYLSGKFKDCGCFGDCIPITPLTSFLKDVALTLFILILFFNRDKVKPWLSVKASWAVMLLTIVFSFGIQFYALKYLPPVDCLPYKVGNNISEKMKIPPEAVPDSFAIRFIYEKGGKKFEFSPAELPADLDTYKYVERTDKLVRKGNAVPAIQGFALTGISGEDSTAVVLSQPYALLLLSENFETEIDNWKPSFDKLVDAAATKNIRVYGVTNRMETAQRHLKNIPLFNCDFTAIRTAARVDPTVYLLRNGTIVMKEGYRRFDKVLQAVEKLSPLPTVPAGTDSVNTSIQ